MHALIDADITLFESSSVGTDKETGVHHSFEYVEAVFLNKIQEILTAVGATEYTLFLTGEGNFREEIATVKPYKGTRVNEKPFHYSNLKAYILSLPQGVLVEGMEADDALAIEQTKDWIQLFGSKPNWREHSKVCNTVICTRDKDLRQVPGWHYGWEMGAQPEFIMSYVEPLGELHLVTSGGEDGRPLKKKLFGTGTRFFYSQMLTGDTVDNIPGLPGVGIVKAFNALTLCKTERELYDVVEGMYQDHYGEEDWENMLNEQAYLLWMVRELTADGKPVMWTKPISYEGEEVEQSS